MKPARLTPLLILALSAFALAEPLNRLLQQLAWDAVTAHLLSGVKSN